MKDGPRRYSMRKVSIEGSWVGLSFRETGWIVDIGGGM